VPTAASSTNGEPLGVITLITWMLTASIGAYMLATVVGRDGLRQQRTVRDGLPPGVLFGHFGLALTGLAVWVSFVATGWVPLAWSAVGLLMPAFGLGICTVTLWTPYPGPLAGPGGAASPHGPHAAPGEGAAGGLTDEVLARALTDDVLASMLVDEVIARAPAEPAGRKRRAPTAAVIPFGHGMAAVATFALAVVTAASTR
jgi:hypothetical protein